jgi:2-methylcitrate dehydratase PrpD
MDTTGTSAAPRSADAATDPAGPTGRLATWLAGTTLEDVPPPVREHAKHLILDGVACAWSARSCPFPAQACRRSRLWMMPAPPR